MKNYTYTKMLNGDIAVFSSFGDDIYTSDIVLSCISCIANEFSKLQPQHVKINGDITENVNSSINKLLKFGPNEFMTTSDFLTKIIWQLYINENCFIYPIYSYINGKRIYKGLYPITPQQVDFLQDEQNIMYIKFTFGNGYTHTMKYKEIIHWRKNFSFNDLMGGNTAGKANTGPLLKTLNTHHTLIESMGKAIKASMSVNGILKINTLLDETKQEEERKKFEEKITNSESGIITGDLKSEYIPIDRRNPVIVDKTILDFIQNNILYHFGVSLPILTGDFNDEHYQAFYEKTLECLINSLGQAVTKTIFTDQELNQGNEIIFYSQRLLFTNTKNKIAVADILGNRGALTDNQLLELFGYKGFEGGDARHMSLNFINRDIANQYQLSKFKEKGGKNEE